jgi:hypothetical protein
MDEKALEYTREHYNKHVVTISYEKVIGLQKLCLVRNLAKLMLDRQ